MDEDVSVEEKQNFLKAEIADKGFDQRDFESFMIEQKEVKEVELKDWTMMELEAIVMKYQLQAKQNPGPVAKCNQVEKTDSIWGKDDLDDENSEGEGEDPMSKINFEEQIVPKNNYLRSKTSVKRNSTNKNDEFLRQKTEESKDKNEKPDDKEKKKEEKKPEPEVVEPGEDSPFFKTTEEIVCNKEEPNAFTENNDLEIRISNPETIKNGFFSRSYVQYTITIKQMDSTTCRKLSDFDWLRAKICELYPGILVPPPPPTHVNLKDDSPKKILYLNRFMNALSYLKIIRSSELFQDFLTLPQVEFDAKKTTVYDKKITPKSLSKFTTMDGILNVSISIKNENKAKELNKEINQKTYSYDRLTKALNGLLAQMDGMSARLKEVSTAFAELSKNYEEDGIIDKCFEQLSEFMEKWSNGYKRQREFFQDEIKYYFKYMQKELSNALILYNSYKASRDAYVNQFNRVKKLKVPQQAEDDMLTNLKKYYGFYLNSLLDNYKQLEKQQQERLLSQFIVLDKNKNLYTQDYNTFIQLININYGENL